jgi:hypothetical protein
MIKPQSKLLTQTHNVLNHDNIMCSYMCSTILALTQTNYKNPLCWLLDWKFGLENSI